MAFTVTHRAEFTDLLGVDWTVDIERDTAPGAIATLQASDEPLTIEWLTPGDDLTLNPVKGSIAKLNVECTTNFQYLSLYNSGDMVHKMKIYYGATLYWQGWVTTDYSEPYDTPPYTVSINAADGLGLLKSIAYDDAGTYYNGRDTQDNILLNVFDKIGYTQFTEYCNLYEDRMDDGQADSPFTQAYVDNDVFKDYDCYTVLENILKTYNAVIRQVNGQFVIYRPIELISTLVYGRIIATGSVTGTSFDPTQIILRPGGGGNLIDVNGGTMMVQPPIKQFTAEQNYGNRESWLDNYKFNADTYNNYLFDNWSRVGMAGAQRPSAFFTVQDITEGVGFLNAATVPNSSYFIYQHFGNYAKATSDVFKFSFDYRIVNETGADVANLDIAMIITDSTSTYYLFVADENKCTWSVGSDTIDFIEPTVPKGQGEWKTFTRTIQGLPVDGPYLIELFPTNKGCWLLLNNIQFYCTSDQIIIKKKKVSRWKNWVNLTPLGIVRFFGGGYKVVSTRETIDREEIVSNRYITPDPAVINGLDKFSDYVLGDCGDTFITNVLEQFMGSLAVSSIGSLTQTATDFVTDFADDYLALTFPSVVLTSSGNTLFFEGTTADDFTGATTIVNATGTLTGTVTTLVTASAGTQQVDTVTITGGSGQAQITCHGLHRNVVWDTNFATTTANFVSDYGTDFPGITVTQGVGAGHDDDLVFTEDDPAGGFASPTIANVSGTLNGTVAHTAAAAGETHRKDQIVLSGSTGTASITVHANAETCTYNTAVSLDYTTSWHTRGKTEAQPVIELISDEIATMYSKGRQFIQLPLKEMAGNPTNFRVTYNIQDPINMTGADYKCFAVSRASFDVASREWTVDIIEIGEI